MASPPSRFLLIWSARVLSADSLSEAETSANVTEFYRADILIKVAVFSEVIYPELCQCRTEDKPELYFTLKATCSLSHVRGCSGCRVYERASPGSKDDLPP